MKQESSFKNYVLSRIKGFLGYRAKRHIVFPEESFIELTLSPKDVQKMLEWERDGAEIVPMWYCNCRRVLFVNENIFEAWKSRKWKP
jgi:hypothetical protein